MPLVSLSLSVTLGLLATVGILPPLAIKTPLAQLEGVLARRKEKLVRQRSREDEEMWAAKMDRLAAEEEAAERARIAPFYASSNIRLPEEIIIRILELAFQSPASTPTSPNLPLEGSTSYLLVCRGFKQIALPLVFSSIYISKTSHWNLFFDANVGLLNECPEGLARRQWVREISILDCILPSNRPEMGRRGSWSGRIALGRRKSFVAGPLQISSDGFDHVQHICIVESPTPFKSSDYVVTRSPKLDVTSRSLGSPAVDPNPLPKHHLLLLQLIQATNPSTLVIPYNSLFDLHLPEKGTLPTNRTPLNISILFPPPEVDPIKTKYQTACFSTNLSRFILGLYESFEWTEMNFVGFPPASQKALSGMRKKYARGFWTDGAEIDWTYNGRRGERDAKALKISIDLAL